MYGMREYINIYIYIYVKLLNQYKKKVKSKNLKKKIDLFKEE